ncbi:hypothetical protein LCM20_11935 [Halobacillus litoralis]|uniref:hypothetical protein n=1 Tax=Halobacillus litoralis TaxID=45668 RepID=UPI001CD4D836|nr:hypothetical protein [Halobacillus litoralis]MCA0971307.1 hypothetical protein [Halobacillus litoralis]
MRLGIQSTDVRLMYQLVLCLGYDTVKAKEIIEDILIEAARKGVNPYPRLRQELDEDAQVLVLLTYMIHLSETQIVHEWHFSEDEVKGIVLEEEQRKKMTQLEQWLQGQDTGQDVDEILFRVEDRLRRAETKKKVYKIAGAVASLVAFLMVGSIYLSQPTVSDQEDAPRIHELVYDRLNQSGYTNINVGVTESERQLIIQIVGSSEDYRTLSPELKEAARGLLDEKGYRDYQIVVEPMAVERSLPGVER